MLWIALALGASVEYCRSCQAGQPKEDIVTVAQQARFNSIQKTEKAQQTEKIALATAMRHSAGY